jgi:hypothetical protein
MIGSAGPGGNAERREARRGLFVGCSCEAAGLHRDGGRAPHDRADLEAE